MTGALLKFNSINALTKGTGELILVVDDEKPILEMASIVFELGGYKVITATNGMLAFEMYEKQMDHIALVMLDLMMPIMDGVELSRRLVNLNPGVKIIVCSGHTTALNEQELRNIGIRAFLPKPYNVSKLLKTVHDVIAGK